MPDVPEQKPTDSALAQTTHSTGPGVVNPKAPNAPLEAKVNPQTGEAILPPPPVHSTGGLPLAPKLGSPTVLESGVAKPGPTNVPAKPIVNDPLPAVGKAKDP